MIPKTIKRQLYPWMEKKYMKGCSHFNDLEGRRASRSKKLARATFAALNAPHAQGCLFINPYKGYQQARKIGFPLVLKPNMGTFSKGSYFPITTWPQFWICLIKVKSYWPETVLESYLEGQSYRVVVIEGKTLVVAHRTPAKIIGDGQHNIAQLIKAENDTRLEMKLLPTMYKISPQVTAKFIKNTGRSLAEVPLKGKVIQISKKISLADGGVLENIDINKIPQETQALFQKILKAFKLRLTGLDLICEKDIFTPLTTQKAIFLEANSRPYLKMHNYPRWGEVPDLSKDLKILSQYPIKDADIW